VYVSRNEVDDLRRSGVNRSEMQALYYRSLEVVVGAAVLIVKFDMWGLGIVVVDMCGCLFTHCTDELALQQSWFQALGPAPDGLLELQPMTGPSDRDAALRFSNSVIGVIGSAGFGWVRTLLRYEASDRPSASAMGTTLTFDSRLYRQGSSHEALASTQLRPHVLGDRVLFAGKRHPWCVTSGHVGCDVERWLRTDPAFVDGTPAHLVLKSALAGELPKQSKIEEDRKLIFAGSIGQCGTTSMCGLRLDPFICHRVTAWLQAFHKKNVAHFDRMYVSVCQRIRSRHLRNGFHFKRTPWQNWILTCAEFVVARPVARVQASGSNRGINTAVNPCSTWD